MTATRALLGWRSRYGVVGLLLSAVRPRCNGAPCASGARGMRRSLVRVSARRRLHGEPIPLPDRDVLHLMQTVGTRAEIWPTCKERRLARYLRRIAARAA
jgi:hypothetical protein